VGRPDSSCTTGKNLNTGFDTGRRVRNAAPVTGTSVSDIEVRRSAVHPPLSSGASGSGFPLRERSSARRRPYRQFRIAVRARVAMAKEPNPCRTLYLPEIATTGGARFCEGVFHVRNPIEPDPQFSAIRVLHPRGGCDTHRRTEAGLSGEFSNSLTIHA
jgi:hypothetical protein